MQLLKVEISDLKALKVLMLDLLGKLWDLVQQAILFFAYSIVGIFGHFFPFFSITSWVFKLERVVNGPVAGCSNPKLQVQYDQ